MTIRKGFIVFLITTSLTGVFSLVQARNANPYPIALIRNGDIYNMNNSKEVKKLTSIGDARELCWLDNETICFSREYDTGLKDGRGWRGFSKIYDLFTIPREGGTVKQFTAQHHSRGPSTGNMPGRVIFWRDNSGFGTTSELWETLKPMRRARPLGVSAVSPDASPDQFWMTAVFSLDDTVGIALYKYPSTERYRELPGPYKRPRFSPDSKLLIFINEEFGKGQIWGFDMPDGEPRMLLEFGDSINRVIDLGWAGDGSGFILVLEDKQKKRDIYYWELIRKELRRLTNYGDVDHATSFH